MIKHICSFSSGLSSAIATDRVLSRFGSDNIDIIFEDTLFEDDDNYRFLRDCENRWNKKIIVLCEGFNPYEIAEKKQLIPNSRMAPCTFQLKINPFKKYLEKNYEWGIIYIGYDFTELERCGDTEAAYNKIGYGVDFPLLWKPYENRTYSKVVREDWGIEPPRMYEMNFTHANCGGRCVKQGKSDWLRLLRNFPDRYKQIENWEQWMRTNPKYSKYTILKIVKKEIVRKITLRELREEYESQMECMPDLFDDTDSPCVVCGVGSICDID